MPDTSVASDLSQPLDIHGDFSSEITFYAIIFSDNFTELADFIIRQIPAPCIGVDACLFKYLTGGSASDTIDTGEPYFDALFSG